MADDADDQQRAVPGGKSVRFVELSGAAMVALLDGSLAEASAQAGVALTPYFLLTAGSTHALIAPLVDNEHVSLMPLIAARVTVRIGT